jgi:hypothetical protein
MYPQIHIAAFFLGFSHKHQDWGRHIPDVSIRLRSGGAG